MPAGTLAIVTVVFLVFLQDFQVNARIVTLIGHNHFLPYPFQVTVH
jgi:hypothetical protein